MFVGQCKLLICALLLFLIHSKQFANAGCADINRCCTGKSSSCKYEYGGYGNKRYTRACYCDEFCQKSGDCCNDYEEHCLSRAQDCVMTYWSHWSHCTARCGRGRQERRRQIHIPQSGGGKPCGAQQQTQACYHSNGRCRNSEIAQLLPAHYNRRRNKPDKWARPSELKKIAARRNSYCVHYKITYAAWYCRYASPYHVLKQGSKVCVECHDTAMNSEGNCQGATMGVVSRWRAMLGHSCHGSWESIDDVKTDCTCGERQGTDFIFV